MESRTERWTAWAGGPRLFALVVLIELVLLVFFALDPRITVALTLAGAAGLIVVKRPLLGVAALIGARLLSTGATVFLRIGKFGIGPFEPALFLCLAALITHAVVYRVPLWRDWPWRAPFLLFCGWVGVSLLWSVDRGDGLSDVIPLALVLANCLVILAFVKNYQQFRLMLLAWVGASVFVGLLTLALDVLGITVGTVTFQVASGGGRETGLGQQPNWYAMNLMFGVLPAFGLAAMEKVRWKRVGLALSAVFVLFMMLKSGSRGSAGAVIIGAGAVGLLNPRYRKTILRAGLAIGVLLALALAFNVGDSAAALKRVSSNLSIEQNYRPLNWLVCLSMFLDTYGRGIGAGGYDTLLPSYNNYLAQSLYDYPHGIFWEVMAHYGLIGIGLMVALLATVVVMARRLIALTRGTEAEVYAWVMPATLLGYFAWSFVEFTVAEKPVWEFLSLYTAFYLAVREGQGPAAEGAA